MLKVSLIGAGRIGKQHAKTLMQNPLCEIAYVADAFEQNAIALAQEAGAKVVSAEEAIAASDIQAVVIASPTDTHSKFSCLAADAGKAVFCEKPIDLNLERARETATYVNDKGIPLMMGFNRRFDPSFAQLKAKLEQLQTLEQLIITSRDPAPPPIDYVKVSGGLFKDMMIHDFDMARWLLPEEPVEVFATGSCLVDPAIGESGDIDTAMVVMKTASGIQCQISNSRRACYGYDQRVEAFGEKGMIRAENPNKTTNIISDESGDHADNIMYFFMDRYDQAYKLQLDAFVEAIANNVTPPTTIDDGVKALALAEAALESMQSGQIVKL